MKYLNVFVFIAVSALFLFTSCKTGESNDAECSTIMDCPLGWECSADNVCVEIVQVDKDNALPDIDNTAPDNNTADNSVVPDEADNEITDEDGIMSDEQDETVTDSDTDSGYDNDIYEDADTADNEADEDAVDADIDEFDTDTADEDINDDDIFVPSEVMIGDGTDTQWIPIGCRLFKYTRSASLYLSSEIGVSAPVTKLAWYDDNGASTSRPVKIYLKETADTVLTPITWADQITGATEVFDGSVFTAVGWNKIVLSAPFSHSGTNNLLILVEMNKGSWCEDDYPAMRFTATVDLHSAWNSDNVPSGNGSVNGSRPNIKIFF